MTGKYKSIWFLGDVATQVPIDLTGHDITGPENLLVVNQEGAFRDQRDGDHPTDAGKYNLTNDREYWRRFGGNALPSIANNHFEDFGYKESVGPLFGSKDFWSKKVYLGVQEVIIVSVAFPNTAPYSWRQQKVANYATPSQALELVAATRKAHSDAILCVFVHWGYELCDLPYPADRAIAQDMAEMGVDLIVGHHPHVVQPVELIGDCVVAYSLGNFVLPEGTWSGKHLSYGGRGDAGLALKLGEDGVFVADVKLDMVAKNGTALVSISEERPIRDAFVGGSREAYAQRFKTLIREGKITLPKGIPVLESYGGAWEEGAILAYQDARQMVRNLLVRAGLHKPKTRRREA